MKNFPVALSFTFPLPVLRAKEQGPLSLLWFSITHSIPPFHPFSSTQGTLGAPSVHAAVHSDSPILEVFIIYRA